MFESLQLGTAFRLLLKTGPILLIRLGLYLAFWVVALVYFGIIIGVGVLLAKIVPALGWIIGIIGFLALGPIYHVAQRYVFFLLKAAHIAIISELLVNGNIPDGFGQVEWGKQAVKNRFGDVSIMFLVDELVRGIINMFTRTVWTIASFIPGDLRQIVSIINRIVRYATNYIDEAVLARSFWRRDQNVWESAEQGVVLYAQVWKPLLKNAIALMILSYIPLIVTFIIFAAPIGGLLALISTNIAAWSVLITLVLAILIKIAIGDSFAMVAIIAAYQRETAQLQPDPAMEARLSQVTNKFTELKQRAISSPQYIPTM